MVPKNIAIAGPERTAMALAPVLRAIARMIGPVIRFLNAWANATVRATGREPRDEVASAFTREEVADLVAQSRAEGLLDAQEHRRIASALYFDVSPVTSVMVPDDSVVSVPAGVSPAEVERACAHTGFSRFPIRRIRSNADRSGAAADGTVTGAGPVSIGSVPTDPPVGPTALRPGCGLLMLEDLLETLVGEIRDATRRSPDPAPQPRRATGA